MLKGPALKSSDLLKCNCRSYGDYISPKFKKPSFAILVVYNMFENKCRSEGIRAGPFSTRHSFPFLLTHVSNKDQTAESKWNVMPCIRRGSNSCFFAALYCSCLGFNALLALPTKEGGNRFNLTCFGGKHYQQLWHSLDKRVELDLKLTKYF